MNGAALTYAVVAVHQSELHAAAERRRRLPRKQRRAGRGPALRPWRRRPRFA